MLMECHINPKVEVKYGSYRFLAEFKYAHYDSIEGVDRIRSTNDFHLVDRFRRVQFEVEPTYRFSRLSIL